MASNVAITAGSGTTIGTEETTINSIAVHVQQVKQVVGAREGYVGSQSGRLVDGSSSEAAAYVDPRWKVTHVKVTPTVSTTPAYTAKDAIGSNQTIAAAVRANGGSGRLTKVVIEDKGQQMKDMDLVFFNTNPAAATDNAIFAPTDSELAPDLCLGHVQIGGGHYADFSTNSEATWVGALPVIAASGSTSLYCVPVSRSSTGPTYTSTSDLVFDYTFDQD